MGVKRYNDFVNEKLNEKVDQYDFEFHTMINAHDVDFYHEPTDESKDQSITTGDLNIHWEMDFDNRKYGISSMGPVINKVSGFYTLITPAEERDAEEEVEFSIDKNSDWEFINQFQQEYTFGSPIVPRSIEVDFKTKKITINF